MAADVDTLNPAVVARLESLELVARTLVEGFLKGLHFSAARGSSTEFAEHRPYVPGDDIRRIDWKTFGKTDRFYLKEYDDESNVRATIVIDGSASMSFPPEGMTKLRYGVCLAAALGYLLLLQRDAVGLAVAREALELYVPPKATAEHLRGIFQHLEVTRGQGPTHLGSCLHQLAERAHAHGLAIVISDFLEDPHASLRGVAHLRHRGVETILFHVMDPMEENFPFTSWTVFRDSEDPSRELRLDARQIREVYRDNLREHMEILRKGAIALQAEYALVSTRQPFELALATYLDARARRSK